MLEVLQYTNLFRGLRTLWNMLAPGGRIVGTVPNRECPIVARTMARFEGAFCPPTPDTLTSALLALDGLDHWGCRGLAVQEDQRIAPYVGSAWSTDLRWPEPPNRMLFVASKRS